MPGRSGAAPGDLDTSFNAAGAQPGYAIAKVGRSSMQPDQARGLARQADGKLVQSGSCRGQFTTRACLARFLSDGTPDLSFNAGINLIDPDLSPGELILEFGNLPMDGDGVAILPSGRILVAASCANGQTGFTDLCVAAATSAGTLDTAFNATGSDPGVTRIAPGAFYNTIRAIAVQPDGRIVVAGACGVQIVNRAFCVARFNADGSIDTGFNAGGAVPGSRVETIGSDNYSEALALALQPDGRIVTVGMCNDAGITKFCAMRLNANGSLDSASFATDAGGKRVLALTNAEHNMASVVIDHNGRIIVAGGCSSEVQPAVYSMAGCVAALLPNGTLDTSGFNATAPTAERGRVVFNFDSTGDSLASIALLPGGKLAVAGSCRYDQGAGTGVICLAQLNGDGSFDASFGTGGKAIRPSLANQRDLAQQLVVEPTGNWLVGSRCFRGAPETYCIARFAATSPSAACALNVDGNTALDVATDGVLILRYLFGLRGAALAANATGSNAQRTGAALESYLAGLDLDADGDGQRLATSDGLLLLRVMLGLSGSALTEDAVNLGHPNPRNAAAIRTWVSSTHGAVCLP